MIFAILLNLMAMHERPEVVPVFHRCRTCVTQSADMAKLVEALNIKDADGNPHVKITGPGAEMFIHRLRQVAERKP